MAVTLTSRLKSFDIYREVPKELTEATSVGACATLLAFVFGCILVVSEFVSFMQTETVSHTFVDSSREFSAGTMEITLDILLPAVPCSIIGVDYQDVMGTHSVDAAAGVSKMRIKDGQEFAIMPSSAEFDTMKGMLGEGCRLFGSLMVKKVPGNFHIATHSHRRLAEQLFPAGSVNMTHEIKELYFGPKLDISGANPAFAPLNGVQQHVPRDTMGTLPSFEYYIKTVPTLFQNRYKETQNTFQFTANTNRVSYTYPVIYFRFDMSPITVKYTEKSSSFSHFLVQVCAIVGGLVTVLGFVSSFIHHSFRSMMTKARMGKLG